MKISPDFLHARHPLVFAGVAYIVGLAAGIGSGVIYMKHRYDEHIRLLEEELNEETRVPLIEEKPPLSDLVQGLGYSSPEPEEPEDVVSVFSRPTKSLADVGITVSEPVAYNNLFDTKKETDPGPETTPAVGYVPTIISEEEYEDSQLVKRSWNFFIQDNLIGDEGDDVVTSPIKFIGDAIRHFGEGSNDPDMVYVENLDLGEVYEVARSYEPSSWVLNNSVEVDEDES